MRLFKKTNRRRNHTHRSTTFEQFSRTRRFVNSDYLSSVLLWMLFTVLCVAVLSFESIQQGRYFKLIPTTIVVVLISIAAAFYIHHYQSRIIKNHIRAAALVGLFSVLLAITKVGMLLTERNSWAVGTAVTAAVILTITYNQRFATGMSVLYCLFACFAAPTAGLHQQTAGVTSINLFLTMAAGVITCCFSLKEVRTRMKLLEVGAVSAAMVFIMSVALGFVEPNPEPGGVFGNAGWQAAAAFIAGLLIQSLLPVIEKIFRIATSMTLLDYSDANQPLLKRLAMDAPGTFSHSLLVGSIAEAAAEAIGRNGLLCRVGAYYHDIGKINKPGYFIENEMGLSSRHKELSPAMSQLIIVGHVKDGMELAREHGLPVVLRQFIETHHGTTLIEYFYNEARKKHDENQTLPSESEFRYPGPRPQTKEAAIVMLADVAEGAVRTLPETSPMKIEAVVHNMAMKRLQDGQFDECDLTLKELSRIEMSISKSLAAHYHGRIAYPKQPHPRQETEADED